MGRQIRLGVETVRGDRNRWVIWVRIHLPRVRRCEDTWLSHSAFIHVKKCNIAVLIYDDSYRGGAIIRGLPVPSAGVGAGRNRAPPYG